MGAAFTDELDAALHALARGDRAAALAPALAAWRLAPDPALADAIDVLAGGLRAPPLVGKTIQARDEAWEVRRAADDPHDVPVLVAHALAFRPSALVPSRLLAELARGPRDPRTTSLLVGAIAVPVFGTGKSHGVWDAIADLLVHHGDPRVHALLPPLDLAAICGGKTYDTTYATRAMERRRARVLAKVPPPPTLAADARAAVAAFAAALRPARDPAAAIAAVRAQPHDLALRDVLRDALLEAGTPETTARGEHMALDALARTRPLLPDELAAQRVRVASAWWAPLEHVAMLPEVRDGCLVACHVSAQHAHRVPPTIGDAAWATVERLDLSYWNLPLPVDLLADPAMRALRALHGVMRSHVDDLWALAPGWLEELEPQFLVERDWQDAFARPEAVPNLRRLITSQRYDRAADYAWLWRAPLFRRLQALAVHLGNDDLATWYAAVRGDAHAHLAELALGRYTFTRDARGALSALAIALPPSAREAPQVKAVVAQLAGLPRGAIERAAVTGRALDRKTRAAIARALDLDVDAIAGHLTDDAAGSAGARRARAPR